MRRQSAGLIGRRRNPNRSLSFSSAALWQRRLWPIANSRCSSHAAPGPDEGAAGGAPGETMEVATLRITEAGRRLLAGKTDNFK
jgi:hypothetical protein